MSAPTRNETSEYSAPCPLGAPMTRPGVEKTSNAVRNVLGTEQIDVLASDRKLAILATLDDDALPHLTLITSLQAKDSAHLMFGQFCEGRAKSNLMRDPRAGFLVMDGSGTVIHGTACWTSSATSGADYEAYNRKPMFRYNAYSGIHRVHYLHLVGVAASQRVNVVRATFGALGAAVARVLSRHAHAEAALTPWAARHINGLKTLKFAAVVGADGFPRIAAAVPCSARGRGHLALGASSLGMRTAALPAGTSIAVLALNLQFESVLVRGRLLGPRRTLAGRTGVVEIEHVYNSMPFKQGPIYPMPPLDAVTSFRPTHA